MRWIKHMTATWQDEKVSRLVAEHGLAGYGLWWRVLEIVASRVEGDSAPSVTYPISAWSHLLVTRGSLVISTLSKLAVTHLVTMERHGSDITVTIPNLLKYRDEYTRKSGHTPDSVRSKKQKQNTEADTEAEAEQKAPPIPFPRQSDFPLTDAAIRGRCPTADLTIVVRITEAAVREYLSVDAPKIQAPDDSMIAAAVEEAAWQSPKQTGPGLFLRTVPAVIRSWAELGRHPPPSFPRIDPVVEAAKRDWAERQKDLKGRYR